MQKQKIPVTATLIAYLHLCHRKVWLHHHDIQMEHTNANVAMGKQIEESTYNRRPSKWKELAFKGIKIDHYDPVNRVVKEVKKSPKLEHAHIAQVKYYLYRLEQEGLESISGIIEYPKQKKKTLVNLTQADRTAIKQWENEIHVIIAKDVCPELIKKPYCRSCAFKDFCFV